MPELWIPTGDLVGCVADVVAFACQDEKWPDLYAVRLEWDRTEFHALATDRYRLGWSRWQPDDPPPGDLQDDLFATWGETDAGGSWAVTVALDDARDLVKTFKLARKQGRVPLLVEANPGAAVTVSRRGDTGHPAVRMSLADRRVDWPGAAGLLGDGALVTTGEVAFTPQYLGDLGKVRPRGPMQMSFTGPAGAVRMVVITMGERFTAAIAPVRLDAESTPDGQR